MHNFKPYSLKAIYDYMPALDGLRAISILFVVLSHAGNGLEKTFPGTLGVIIFFVISGFLITRQIITEIQETQHFNIRHFYLRRIFRLLPALLFYLIIFTPILMYLGATISVTHILSAVFYFANYYHIFVGFPLYNPMPIVWSLSVEEHYYIVFPFLLLAFRNKLTAILPLLFALLFIALVWRITLYEHCVTQAWQLCGLPDKIRAHGTDTIVDCILYGSITAITLHFYNEKVLQLLINQRMFCVGLFGIILSLAIRNPEFRETLRYSLQSLCISIIILNILYNQWQLPRKLLSCKPLVFIGRISYSLYLMHFGVLITIEAINNSRSLNGPIQMLLYFFLSLALASISYFYVEQPMIKIRKIFGSHRAVKHLINLHSPKHLIL